MGNELSEEVGRLLDHIHEKVEIDPHLEDDDDTENVTETANSDVLRQIIREELQSYLNEKIIINESEDVTEMHVVIGGHHFKGKMSKVNK